MILEWVFDLIGGGFILEDDYSVKEIVRKFKKRNSISDNDLEENYLKFFPRKLWGFLNQKSLNSLPEVRRIIEKCIEDCYFYYSENIIKKIFVGFHKRISEQLINYGVDINKEAYFIPIPNKDTYKSNSSVDMITMYIKSVDLPNSSFKLMNDLMKLEVEYERLNDKNQSTHDRYVEDKEKEIERWRGLLEKKKILVFIDDYSGTGSTIKDFIEKIKDYLPEHIYVIIFCIHGTKKALDVIHSVLEENCVQGTVIFQETSDCYFKNNKEDEEKIESFETEIVRPSRKKDILGFQKTESVVTTYRNTPNNTLSLFWSEKVGPTPWRALFPRRDKDGKIHASFSCWVSETEKLNYFLTLKEVDKSIEEEIKVLIYILNTKKDTLSTKIELSRIVCYSDCVIQECLNKKFIEEIDDSFKLSDLGIKMLENYNLSKVNWKEINRIYQKKGERVESIHIK